MYWPRDVPVKGLPLIVFNAAEGRMQRWKLLPALLHGKAWCEISKAALQASFSRWESALWYFTPNLCLQNFDLCSKVRVLGSRKMLCSRLGAVQRLLAPELKGGDAAAEKQERQASIQFRFCKSKGSILSIESDNMYIVPYIVYMYIFLHVTCYMLYTILYIYT